MSTQITKGELVNKSNQLLEQIKKVVERKPEEKRMFIYNNEKLKKLFVDDIVTSLRDWDRDGSDDYHLFIEFCYDLVNKIEVGRTLEMEDKYGNRYQFQGHLTIPNWRGELSRVCIDYKIPEMELEWLTKSQEFFQKRVNYWEQLTQEDDLSRFFPHRINHSEEGWLFEEIQFLHEILRDDINEKLKIKDYGYI